MSEAQIGFAIGLKYEYLSSNSGFSFRLIRKEKGYDISPLI